MFCICLEMNETHIEKGKQSKRRNPVLEILNYLQNEMIPQLHFPPNGPECQVVERKTEKKKSTDEYTLYSVCITILFMFRLNIEHYYVDSYLIFHDRRCSAFLNLLISIIV